jgi:hypothetical protein
MDYCVGVMKYMAWWSSLLRSFSSLSRKTIPKLTSSVMVKSLVIMLAEKRSMTRIILLS